MSELKPCPYCGDNSVKFEQTERNRLRMYCQNGCFSYYAKCFHFSIEHLQELMTIKFNTRPIEDALQAKIDEQAKVIEKFEEMSKWIRADMDSPDTGDCIEFIDSNDAIHKGYFNHGYMDTDLDNMQISDVIGWRLRGAR